jgi:hypothetical protein
MLPQQPKLQEIFDSILGPSPTHQDHIALGMLLAAVLAIIRLSCYKRGPTRFWLFILSFPLLLSSLNYRPPDFQKPERQYKNQEHEASRNQKIGYPN